VIIIAEFKGKYLRGREIKREFEILTKIYIYIYIYIYIFFFFYIYTFIKISNSLKFSVEFCDNYLILL